MSQDVARQPVVGEDRPTSGGGPAVGRRIELVAIVGGLLAVLALALVPWLVRLGILSWVSNSSHHISDWGLLRGTNRTTPPDRGVTVLALAGLLAASAALLIAVLDLAQARFTRQRLQTVAFLTGVAGLLGLVLLTVTVTTSWAVYWSGLRQPAVAVLTTGLTMVACLVLLAPLVLIQTRAFRVTFPPPAMPVGERTLAGGAAPALDSMPTTNGFAIASFVLGLVGLLICGVGSILAIVFGHTARSQIARAGGRQGGTGLALAGLILGYVSVGLVVIGLVVLVGLSAR